MKFEEWFKVEYPNQHVFKESTLTCKSFYDGASAAWDYKQSEIDALKSVITKQEITMLQIQQSCSGCDSRDLLIDELQKRIVELEAKREGFMLVPLTKETAVAIEQKVEQQLEASGITADPFRLDGWAILDAISAVGVQNGLD